MKLLLDTHIWIWALLDPEKLGSRLKRKLGAADTELWLSPVSTWELGVLADRGRVRLEPDVESWMGRALAAVPMREAPLTHEIAWASRRVDVPHGDPADRFLAATALVLGLTLATADERLLRCKSFPVLANR